ncbi:MAG: hypothetical protein QOI63_1515, partial [Thermoplasmata archaeon]|nr:hypothetical protein [Thermoplasmata archaeon]
PPFTAAQRPQEEFTDEVLAAAVSAINQAHAQDPFAFVLFTGDSVDNALENELMRFLDVVEGTATTVGPVSGLACQPDGQSVDTADAAHDVRDSCTALPAGLAHPGLTAGLPWYQVLGNHDKLIQGNLAVLPAFQQVAAQHGRHFLTPAEFVAMHPAGHGLANGTGDYAFNASATVRLVVLDTVSPGRTEGLPADQLGAAATAAQFFGHHADGTLDDAQRAWLDGEAAAHPDKLVVVASHQTLGNFAPPTTQTCVLGACIDTGQGALGEPLADAVARDLEARPNVVAWLGGHSHRDHIQAYGGAGGGFWSIETASLIDAPQEARIVEVWMTADGHKGFLRTEPLPVVSEPANTLAAGDPQRMQGAEGGPQDRSTRLWFNLPAGFVAPQPPAPTPTATQPPPAPTGGPTLVPVTSAPTTALETPTAETPTAAAPSPKDILHSVPAPGALLALLLLAVAARRR